MKPPPAPPKFRVGDIVTSSPRNPFTYILHPNTFVIVAVEPHYQAETQGQQWFYFWNYDSGNGRYENVLDFPTVEVIDA